MELEEGDSDGAADRAQTLGILDDSRFGRFLDVIEGLEPRRLAGFVPRLAELVPADEALRDLVDRVASRMISPDALAATADAIAYQTGDARWAYQFLLER